MITGMRMKMTHMHETEPQRPNSYFLAHTHTFRYLKTNSHLHCTNQHIHIKNLTIKQAVHTLPPAADCKVFSSRPYPFMMVVLQPPHPPLMSFLNIAFKKRERGDPF